MWKRITLIAVAVALAAAGTTGVGLYANSADTRALEGQQVVEAFFAVDTVPEGTSAEDALANGLIERQSVAAKGVPEGALTEFDEAIQDLVARTQIAAGSVVMRNVFGERDQLAQTGGLVIPKGKVAVSVTLQDQGGDAIRMPGLVVGSQVAVFNTFNVYKGPGAPKANTPSGDGLSGSYETVQATRLVIPRAEVIAIGGAEGSDDNGGDKGDDNVVTLAISQSETERMAQVALTGHPSLVLLGPESDIKPGTGVDNRNLFDFGGKP